MDLCRLQDCDNWRENPTEAITETDDEDDDYISRLKVNGTDLVSRQT